MKITIVLVALLTSGCFVSNEEFKDCTDKCSVNGGFSYIAI
ncbi:hypothetical protein LCGC14_3027480, partial [marine sediment metagenome]